MKFSCEVYSTGSQGNLATITGGGTNVILDAGVAPEEIEINWRLPTVLLLTHSHNDHSKYVGTYERFGVTIIRPEVAIGNRLEVYGVKLTAVEGKHDVPVAIYLFDYFGKRVLYATDTARLPSVYITPDLAIVEGNYLPERLYDRELPATVLERIRENHMSIEDTARWLWQVMPPKAIIWHASNTVEQALINSMMFMLRSCMRDLVDWQVARRGLTVKF